MTKPNHGDSTPYLASFRYSGLFTFSVSFSSPGLFSFATPFVRLERDKTDGIRKDCPVFFAPAIGAVIYNFELARGELKTIFQGKEGFEIRTLNPSTASSVFGDSIAPFFHREIGISGIREEERPEAFEKIIRQKEQSISPWENALAVTRGFLELDNPQLARSIKSGKSNEACAKAFVADVIRRNGSSPAGFSTDDPEFVAMVADAHQAYERREKRKSKVDPINWHIAHPRNWCRYYCMEPEQIAKAISVALQIEPELSAGAIQDRIEKNKLFRHCKTGPRPKKRFSGLPK